MNEDIPAFIGRAKCGCIVAMVIADEKFPETTKRGLCDMVDDNLIIDRVTVGFCRQHGFEKCKDHKAEQPSLLGVGQ